MTRAMRERYSSLSPMPIGSRSNVSNVPAGVVTDQNQEFPVIGQLLPLLSLLSLFVNQLRFVHPQVCEHVEEPLWEKGSGRVRIAADRVVYIQPVPCFIKESFCFSMRVSLSSSGLWG